MAQSKRVVLKAEPEEITSYLLIIFWNKYFIVGHYGRKHWKKLMGGCLLGRFHHMKNHQSVFMSLSIRLQADKRGPIYFCRNWMVKSLDRFISSRTNSQSLIYMRMCVPTCMCNTNADLTGGGRRW